MDFIAPINAPTRHQFPTLMGSQDTSVHHLCGRSIIYANSSVMHHLCCGSHSTWKSLKVYEFWKKMNGYPWKHVFFSSVSFISLRPTNGSSCTETKPQGLRQLLLTLQDQDSKRKLHFMTWFASGHEVKSPALCWFYQPTLLASARTPWICCLHPYMLQ